jgi:asparagine synthase (glutamine-hydrolysing)
VRNLADTVWHLERPFGNMHSVAKIMQSRYAREHVVCVLTGDGGDESFCGYSTYWLQNELQRADYRLDRIQDKLAKMKREAKAIGGNRYYLSGGLARKVDASQQFMIERLGFRQRIERSPVERVVDWLGQTIPKHSDLPHATLLQYVQLNSTVPEYIATIADRAEWAGSVEARPPLFDHKVVELAMGLPIEAKIRGDREKHILREAFKDRLPADVTERRKQAFLAPPPPFQCSAGRAMIDRYLNPQAIRDAAIWDPLKIRALKVARRIAPRNRIINIITTVVLTAQILHEQFIVRQGSSPH